MDTPLNSVVDVVQRRIDKDRRELLDLSARNRLINTPRGASKGRRLDIVDERSEEVFRLLVRDGKSMSFDPGAGEAAKEPGEDDSARGLEQPEGDFDASALDPRHTDLRLQTRLASDQLQSRLLRMYYDAQTHEQEQGVGILFLAMGFLKWYESPSSDKPRYAPLLLIPVDLRRPSAAGRFHLRHREEDVTTNLSLQAKLRAEFGLELPDVPEMEELSPEAYFGATAQAIADQPRWEVLHDDMVVWFFSFAKFLMYRDLDPASWPADAPLGSNPALSGLLGGGFVSEPPLCGRDDAIDPLIPPATTIHVTDADSSQAMVIEEVRRGRHLVVQGPPGTGKSQTITNLIASAVKEGKKVLFVAEKMAALEVVHGRLERLGLDAICLELHSNKANKKAVLDELARTLALGRPRELGASERLEALQAAIERLNHHANVMNTPLAPAGVTPFRVIGRLSNLYDQGVEATNLTLAEAATWSPLEYREKRRTIEELRSLLAEIGSPAEHAWRGVNRADPILPEDQRRLRAKLDEIRASLSAIAEAFERISESLDLPRSDAHGLLDAQRLAQLALRVEKAPPMDRQAIANPAWNSQREEITRLVEAGRAGAETRAKLQETLAEIAWRTDLAATRRSLAAHGRSLFRWLRRDYRDALATLRGVLKGDPPKSLGERLELVDAIINVQTDLHSLDNDPIQSRLGGDAFGTVWRGSKSNWSALAEIVTWELETRSAELPWNCRDILARANRPEIRRSSLDLMRKHLKPASHGLQDIVKLLSLNCEEAFGGKDLHAAPIHDILTHIESWLRRPEALSKWINYQIRRRRLSRAGLDEIVSKLHEGEIDAGDAVDLFDVAYYQALIREVFRRHPTIAEFDGQSHERLIEAFRSLDQARIEAARAEVAAAHHDAIPRAAVGGEMAVVRREIEKKRRHKPIRQLLKEAGTAILAIKPVFMMSPISIAQYLEPGGVTFDLLLIDEASQVSPVDALGAMARARRIVVVGDDKQLPPSRFFSKMLDEADQSEDADELSSGDLESILGLCVAQGMPRRLLRWHYRSRHESLIAVSNHEFYDNDLYVVPSPTTLMEKLGLRFRFVKNGVFDRGRSATNRVEAKVVAEAVIEHARHFPKQSLGVGAFSVAQRDAIRDELEVLQRQRVELAGFFSPGRPDPFFVKNLENIQGDERDVIFISVGYARDESGYMAMNFGPLSSQGGERRLNVLISRARERCEVFSSITADDIDLQRAKSRGAAAFKTFLRYAETGVLDTPKPTNRGYDSDFEKQVAKALEGHGCEVHCQVGTSGFFIDLAVVDPNRPGRYLLGIECDGATYHSSRSARDRDRLREAVLRDRGWRIHRVWSTDWFHRPEEQTQKILDAIEKAKLESETDEEPEPEASGAPGSETGVERADSLDGWNGGAVAAWAPPYVEALLEAPSGTPIHETSPFVLAQIVASVVEFEGPIHRDEIARRITSLWGLSRTGGRISDSVSEAIESGLRSGVLLADSAFITHQQQTTVPVRCRSEVNSPNLRKPEMIPPAELRQAIQHLAAEHVGLHRHEVPALVGKALGFKATSAKLKGLIEEALSRLLDDDMLALRDEKLFLRPTGDDASTHAGAG